LPEGVAAGPEMKALAATWGAAVASASAHDGARRLSEQLAETNRSLVEARSRWAEAQSLMRLGEMAAGAAHEMNNPLTVISGRSQMLVSRLTERKDKAAAASIAEAAQHLSNLITSLRLLADPPAPVVRAVPVPDLVSAAVALAEARAGSGRVKVALPRTPLDIELDRELVESALAEPIINALEAAPDGQVRVHVQKPPSDDRILIVISDEGPGLSDRALQHAFDPFFSDKPAGRQTGLGLTRARRLLELHGGTIRIESPRDEGTTVRIELPLVTPRATPTRGAGSPEQLPVGPVPGRPFVPRGRAA
jgi:signal transduction histidine kinase